MVPQEKRDAAANAIQEGMKPYTELSGGPVSKAVGYGGESLMEFLAGDEAIKGLSLAKKLEAMSGITKVLEQSPRTMNATRLGALVGKVLEHAGVSTISASTVAGLQTFLRSGGDFNQALQDALHTAEFAAPLSAATETLGEVATAAGKNAAGYEKSPKSCWKCCTKRTSSIGNGRQVKCCRKTDAQRVRNWLPRHCQSYRRTHCTSRSHPVISRGIQNSCQPARTGY